MERQTPLELILDSDARKRFNELVDGGFDRAYLSALLCEFAHTSKERKPPLTGMKNRELVSLVLLICKVISKIEAVNDEFSRRGGLPCPTYRAQLYPWNWHTTQSGFSIYHECRWTIEPVTAKRLRSS